MKVILESEDRENLSKLVTRMVDRVEEPDEPLFGVAGSSELLSPRQLADAVKNETELGMRYIENLSEVVAQAALDDVTRKMFGISADEAEGKMF